MKRFCELLVLCISIFLSDCSFAENKAATDAEQGILKIFPNSISAKREGIYHTLSFCPDNTCTEFPEKIVIASGKVR